eukprot:564913-Rhodomonas_salina.1
MSASDAARSCSAAVSALRLAAAQFATRVVECARSAASAAIRTSIACGRTPDHTRAQHRRTRSITPAQDRTSCHITLARHCIPRRIQGTRRSLRSARSWHHTLAQSCTTSSITRALRPDIAQHTPRARRPWLPARLAPRPLGPRAPPAFQT